MADSVCLDPIEESLGLRRRRRGDLSAGDPASYSQRGTGMTLTSNSQFRVGDVIGQSFQTTLRNIVPFGILAIIAAAIMFVIYTLVSSIFGLSVMPMEPGMMEPGMGAPEIGPGFFIGFLVFELLALAVYLSFMTAITYGTFQDLRGHSVGIGTLIQSSIALVGPAITTFLLVIGIFLVAAIVAIILQFIPIIGQIATAVMFVFLYIIFWVVIPVAVIERPGPVASLKRSVALTEGHRWKILGIFLLVIAISIAAMIVAMIFNFLGLVVGMIVLAVLYAALLIFTAVLVAVGYYKLRAAKEGADLGDIARVFD
jgi:hypothetical protein